MKNLLTIVFTAFVLSSNAQSFQSSITYSTGNHLGSSLYYQSKKGIIVGFGGSYLMNSYTGDTNGNYQELANVHLGNNGDIWTPEFNDSYKVHSFTENRGSINLQLGYNVNKLSIIASTGLGFITKYWKGQGYDFSPQFTSPDRNFYVYKNVSPKALLGVFVGYSMNDKVGIVLGYDNSQKISAGIKFNIPTK